MRKCYSASLLRIILPFLALFLVSQLTAQVTVTIGAGSNTTTTSNGATGDAGPMYCTGSTSSFIFSKHHMVYTASELATANVPAGVLITKIEWNKANDAAYSSTAASIFDIYLKNSTATGVPATVPQSFAAITTGATRVYASTTQSFSSTIGWVEFNLPTPFLYTGGALELTTNWDISAGGNSAAGATGNFAWAKDPGINILAHAAATQSPDFTALRTVRAQIRFTYVPASPCTSPPTAGTTVSSSTNVCAGVPFSLSLSGASLGTGQTYQWQTSPDGNAPWTDIGGATSSFYSTSQSVTTYYRCALTCSGNTTYSTPVQVTSPPLVSGVFTINSGAGTGGTNFQTFADAVNYIKCGINGPVTFNVVQGSGPYNEQVVIPAIGGTSTVNTITFNGNLATLSFSSANTNARAGILLNGADHVIIDSLIIDGSAGTYAWGVVLTGQADSNIVRNCTINIGNVGSSSSNYAGVLLNGSATSTGVSGNNANGNLFENNTINGGYYGYYVYGNSTANNANNRFVNNIIRDSYAYGFYLIYQSNLLISGNEISRPTRTNSTTIGAVYLTTSCENALIEKNRVHNMFDAFQSSTSTSYGVYVGADATPGRENKVINNLIYNIGGNGTAYGIYNTSGDNMQAYHNTVSMDDVAATSGSVYGLYQTTAATGIDFRNNIATVSRSGTGTKRCVYFATTGSAITCNNNILYMNASGGTNNHLGQFGTTNYTTFADWQTANSGAYDQQSLNLDPQYTNPSTGDYIPTNTAANNTGVNVGVATDIRGNARSASTPDVGAYEYSFLVTGINMSAESLVSPAVSPTGCYTSATTVSVRIRNNGSSAINFATSPVTVTVNVTGAATQLFTVIINNGTLASDATMDVVMPGTLNMSAAGVYVFNAFTTVTGDTNPTDDAMLPAERTKELLNAGTAAATPANVCISQPIMPVLSTDGTELGYSSLQWQQSTTTGTGFTDIPGASTANYTVTVPLTQTMYYRLVATCGSNSQTTPETTVTLVDPQVTSVAPGTRCGPGTVTLGATTTAGADLNWFEAATGGSPLVTGNSFTTPFLTATKTYYVAANIGGAGTQNVGAPNLSIGAASPVATYYLNFTVLAPVTIQSVNCYFNAVGAPFVINIREAATTTSVFTYSGTTTVSGETTPQVIMLNATLPPGNYQIGWTTDPGTYRNSSGGNYPYTIPGVISITGNSFNDLNYYYYFYNWAVVTGCESIRVPVTATISAAPEFSVAQDTTVCNNAITALSVASAVANFDSYVWTPATDLYTDAAATVAYSGGTATTVYHKSSATGVHKYYINAANSSTSCTNLDSVTITVLPASIAISAVQSDLCAGVSTTLSIPSGEYGNSIQWYTSADGVAYSPIAGASAVSFATPALTDTTFYKVEIRNGAGVVCQQATIRINVNDPQVASTTPDSRCSPGTVTLGATGAAGTTLRWYEAATGGIVIGSGNTFTTPSLTTTTTYYVAAVSGTGSTATGMPAALSTATSGAGTTNFGLVFDALAPFTLQTVTIYPLAAAAGTSGTVTIDVIDGTGAVLHTATVNVTGNPSSAPVAQTVTLNFNIQPGTNLKLRPGSRSSGITGLLFEPSVSAPGGNYGYPYIIPGVLSINTSTLTAAPTNTARNDLYYYFYNWVVTTGCESVRVPVTATISSPALSVHQDTTVCNNAITALSITSDLASFNSFVWSPAAGLFTDAAATTPYAGGSATTVYAKTAAAGVYKYYVNASNSVTTCANFDSVTVTVLPAALTIGATRTQICGSGTTTLSLPAGEYGDATFQWYTSTDGVTYSPIAGAASGTYTTPTITADTYYKVEVKNPAGSVCLQPAITIAVGTPLLLTSTPAVRCGPGSVNLTATVSPATAIASWYETATGGNPVATGSTFVTPSLTASKTYYVASTFGASAVKAGRTAPVSPTNLAASPRGIQFNATQAVRITTVKVFSTAADPGSGTIELQNASGAVLAGPVSVSWPGGGSTTNPVAAVLSLNFDVPVGNAHKLMMTTRTGGGIAYETSGITGTWSNYTSPGGAIELTASMTSATGTSTSAYYYFYDWQIASGCESPRTAVTATINPAPVFSVARDSVVCNNTITALAVESNPADFDTYAWSPAAGLYTDAAATIPYTGGSITTLYAKPATPGVYKYYITANNNTTTCGGLDSVKLTVLPSTLSIQATKEEICGSGTTTLSVASAEYGNNLQWYSSPDGVGYTPIAGANGISYTSPTLTATTYYKAEVKNSAGVVCLQSTKMIAVGTPEVVSTASATRCDPGSVTLGATPGPTGATINWYAAATGGMPIATGTSFTTPVLAATTTYYAASAFGYSLVTAGRTAPASATALSASPRGIQFNATQAVRIASVTVFSTAADGGSGTIELRNSSGTVIGGPVSVSWGGGGTAANPVPYVLNLNLDVPVGTGHRLLMATRTGGSIAYETSGITGTWPNYTSPGGAIELTASMTSATGTSTSAYYYFFNWQISTGCESARTPVDAIINGTITIDADPVDKSLCGAGQEVVFSVTASGAITSYQWRKGGVDIPGATSPVYTITNASAADAGTYDVVVSGPCSVATSGSATLTLVVPATITADPVGQAVCPAGSVTFTASATGEGSLGYQWRKDGINITGAYGTTFTLSNASAADIGSYDIVVTGVCNQDTSAPAVLTLANVTAVATQPMPQVVCAGTNVTLTATGTGSGTLSYQWRKGGVNIPGANSSDYTINGAATTDAGNYDVVITGDCGSAVSAIAGLVVNAATTITAQPTTQSTCIGSSVTFSVSATGAGVLTYQWRKDGVNIAGATSSSYTINGATAADIAGYDVIITGTCGTLTSASANLTISAPGTWIGVQNADWNNTANWCGTVPTSSTDVMIPAYAPNMPVLSNAGFARNIVIASGATVTVAAGGVLNLYGDITGTGTFIPASGTIAFRGATSQVVPPFTAANVVMNGAGGFTLAGNTMITGTLTMTNGHITLGSNNLTLGEGSNGSTASHIITNGNGTVIVSGLATATSRTIPVGVSAASYTPVILTANAGHVTDDLTVKVQEHVFNNGTSGTQFSSFVVDRTWLINEAVPGGSNVNVTLQWNEGDELPQFGRNESYVMQYSGGAWVTGTEAYATGANPYAQTKTNVTSFSPFAVQTDPLPGVSTGIYPNPVKSTLNVIVRTNAPEKLSISIFDPAGKLVKTQSESVGYGGTLLNIDVTGLSAGVYILKISIPKDREFFVRRFVKVN